MARLIDADELLKDNTWEWFDEWGNYTSAGQAIADAPTVDAVEVVRQLWKKTTEEKPSSTKHLIVTDGGLISHYGYYVKPKDKWYKTRECKEEISEPAFWMDMPEPPPESILDECCC